MNEREIVGIDEKIYESTLDSGLKVYMWVRKDINTFYGTYSIKYGSLHTNFKIGKKTYQTPPGIAHYLEHLKFNIAPNLTAHDLFKQYGSDTNAFTTFRYTNYQVLGNNMPYENINILLDMAQVPYFNKKLIEKERGIITEEAGMGQDDPFMIAMYGLLKNMFKSKECSTLITGSPDDIKKITVDIINLVFDAYYHPKNSFITITGNFNPYEMIAMIKENQSSKEFIEYQNPVKVKTKEPKNVIKTFEEIEGNVTNAKIKVGVKIPINDFKEIELFDLLLDIKIMLKANFGSTSDFKNELVDKELINNIFYSVACFDDYVMIFLTLDTNYKTEVLDMLNKKLDSGMKVDEKAFKRIVNSSLATMILQYEDVESVNSAIQDDVMLYGEVIYNKKERLENLKYKDLKLVLDNIDFTNRSTFVIVPFKK